MNGRYQISRDSTYPLDAVFTDDKEQALDLAHANHIRGTSVTVTDTRTGEEISQ
jgi:hypothetical protein